MRPEERVGGLAVTLALGLAFWACRADPLPQPASQRARATRRSNVPLAEILSAGKKRFSQGKEELIIRDFFQDRRGGFFLDVGCAWAKKNSNTFYLEKVLGWSGIGVDALAEYGAEWQKLRPRSKFFSYLVTDHADTVDRFYRAELSGVSSVEKPDQHPERSGMKIEETLVPTTTLDRLLERNGVAKVDFLSMDIEGAELQALAGFDISRFRTELACIEAKPQNRDKLLAYFRRHGYEQIERYAAYDRTNYYFSKGGR